MPAGRVLDAGLALLDRQIVDRNGRFAGKVDDLELAFPAGGSGPPFVTAVLSGPGALARRLGGRLGRWVESMHVRLHPHERPGPARVPFGVVKRLESHLEITVSRRDLESDRFERWVRELVISKITGAADAPE